MNFFSWNLLMPGRIRTLTHTTALSGLPFPPNGASLQVHCSPCWQDNRASQPFNTATCTLPENEHSDLGENRTTSCTYFLSAPDT